MWIRSKFSLAKACGAFAVTLISLGMTTSAHAYSTPVTVKNTEANPVPTTDGRARYEFLYSLSASPATVESCQSLPVPAGRTLVITMVGVDTRVDPTQQPDVYLLARRGGTIVRYRGQLNFVSSSTSTRRYKGIYNLDKAFGEGDSGTSFSAAICLKAPPGGTTFGSTARGTVSGYVEDSEIIDGNSLLP